MLQDERTRLMPNPRRFDGYVEQTLRVSSTSLIHFQRNRYSVPTEYAVAFRRISMSSFALANSLRRRLFSASRSLTGRRLELGVLGDGPVAASALPLCGSRHQFPNVATGTPSLRAASC